jgi:hypothetical protein
MRYVATLLAIYAVSAVLAASDANLDFENDAPPELDPVEQAAYEAEMKKSVELGVKKAQEEAYAEALDAIINNLARMNERVHLVKHQHAALMVSSFAPKPVECRGGDPRCIDLQNRVMDELVKIHAAAEKLPVLERPENATHAEQILKQLGDAVAARMSDNQFMVYYRRSIGPILRQAAFNIFGDPTKWSDCFHKEWYIRSRAVADGLVAMSREDGGRELV